MHAGTGQGKTAIAVGPHLHPSTKGKVTLMVSPLIALHDEMVRTFLNQFSDSYLAVARWTQSPVKMDSLPRLSIAVTADVLLINLR